MDTDKNKNTVDNNEEVFNNTSAGDDIVPEEEGQNIASLLKKLREKLKTSEAEKMEYLSGWQRAKADLINGKKQMEADRVAFISYAEVDLIGDLLSVLSGFDAAMGNKENWEKAPKEWRIGIESIFNLFLSALKKRGLEIIDPIGLPFDPTRDEAVQKQNVSNKEKDGIIIAVVSKGYKLKDRILQPARVIIGELEK